MNATQVKTRLFEVGVPSLVMTQKEVKELPRILQSDETIRYATNGLMNRVTWLIVVTNHRVLFLNKGFFYGLKQLEISIDKIRSLSHKLGLLYGEVRVYHGTTKVLIKQIEKESITAFIDAIHAEIAHTSTLLPLQKNMSQTVLSPMDELLKCQALFDAGVLTEAQFNQKKEQLLAQ